MLLRDVADGRKALHGKVAIVTGASSGIGAATARELAARGAKVVLAPRREDLLETNARAIRSAGAEVLVVPTDVTDGEQLRDLVTRATATFGCVDILVNNAGANGSRPLAATHPEEIARLLDVNLLGAMLLTRAVLPGMLERRSGAVISVGSL